MDPEDETTWEAFEGADTRTDDIRATEVFAEPVTRPHRTAEYNAGREAGFSEGVERAGAAVFDELRAQGFSVAEAMRVSARIVAAARDRG